MLSRDLVGACFAVAGIVVVELGHSVAAPYAGQVLADARGRTIYLYNCNDDAIDQLDCSHPSQPQAYRLALCGKGDWKRCQETFPYLIAGQNMQVVTGSNGAVTVSMPNYAIQKSVYLLG